MNGETWESATAFAEVPTPLAAGTVQTVTIGGLDRLSWYSFGLRAADDVPNWTSPGHVECVTADVGGWGGPGRGDGQFDGIEGIAIDGQGNVLVADGGNYRVQKFSVDGAYLGQWGSQGSAPGQFSNHPYAIAVHPDGTVFVSDSYKVQRFDAAGVYLGLWPTRFGEGEGQISMVMDLAIDAAGRVYVTDRIADRLQVFADDGNFLRGFKEPSGWDPTGVAVTSGGNVVVTELWYNQVLVFSSELELLDASEADPSAQRVGDIVDVAFDADGAFYVADYGYSMLRKLAPDLEPVWHFGGKGTGEREFQNPRSLAVHPNGTVVVTDEGGDRIRTFR